MHGTQHRLGGGSLTMENPTEALLASEPEASHRSAWSPDVEMQREPTPSKEVVHLIPRNSKSRERLPLAKQAVNFDEASDSNEDEMAPEGPPWHKIALKVFLSVTIFLLLTCLLEHFANDAVTKASRKLMNCIGLPGLFIAILLADGLPQPFTYVPLIFMAVEGAVPKPVVFLICMTASYVAALCGYAVGSFLRVPTWGREWFESVSLNYPYVQDLMERKGALGVLLAAMLPMPLAIATWTAGFFGVDRRWFMVAAIGRCPKIAVFVLLSPSPSAT